MPSRDSGIDFSKENPWRCGVVLGSGIGGLETIEIQHQRLIDKGPDKVSAFTIPKLIGNAASAQLSIQYGLRGPNQVVVTACASATNAIGDSYKLIRDDEADVIITGGSEAALTHIGLSAFAAMRALSERNDDPTRASRPFDRDRDGFVLSEGAGLLVLEELEHAKARGAHIYGEMLRLRRQLRRRAHHRPGQGRRRRRLRHDAGDQGRPDQPRATSTTSTPTARALRWATRPKPSPSRASSRTTPTRSASPAPRASWAICWAPAAAWN